MAILTWLLALVAWLAALIPAAEPTVEPTLQATPVPTATVAAVPTPYATPPPLGLPGLICSYSWPCDEALAVVYGPTPPNERAPIGCPNGESGGNPTAVSPSGLHLGLFQMHVEWHGWRVLGGPRRRLTDPGEIAQAAALLLVPALNIEAAHELYVESGGWGHWSCRP